MCDAIGSDVDDARHGCSAPGSVHRGTVRSALWGVVENLDGEGDALLADEDAVGTADQPDLVPRLRTERASCRDPVGHGADGRWPTALCRIPAIASVTADHLMARLGYRREMATWDDLKVVLSRLREQDPGALAGYPDPRVDRDRHPPFGIRLAPWATDVAADLDTRFGADVELLVGALDYPSCTLPSPVRHPPSVPDLDPTEMNVALDGPLIVRSGHSESHGLLIENLSVVEVQIATNGHVTADVVDLSAGRFVGGFTGAQHLPSVMFRVTPGTTQRIPLLVGTASFVPALGYAIPPGRWALQVTLTMAERGSCRTPPLPFTVTG